MLEKIKNKILMAGLVVPAYAADINLKTNDSTTFGNLEGFKIGDFVSSGIGLILIVVAVVFFFILVIGGLKWITSGGDEKKVAAARAQITNALIGLAIVFASWAIISLIGTLTGFSLTNLTIKKIGT